MTVYPFVIRLGPLEITGFGIMVMMGFFMAGWVMQQRLRELDRNEHYAWDIVVAAVIGGLVGAKLWYAGLYGPRTLLERAGLVWYGGLLGGAAAVLLSGWWRRVPMRFTLELAAPALAVGQALGRVGCFLVQDDYGVPTSLPWGMRFPEGLPPSTAQNLAAWGVEVPDGANPFDVLAVHPTQLYEAAALVLAFWILWRLRRSPRGTGWLFGLYLMLAGTERFLVEFIRAKDDRFFGTFTLAQLTSLAAVAVGAILAAYFQNKPAVDLARVDALTPPGAKAKG